MTQEVLEKIYEKIDKELGDAHVEEVVKNLMNTENEEEALKNLTALHQQCCSVFLKYPRAPSTTSSRASSTKKKIVKK